MSNVILNTVTKVTVVGNKIAILTFYNDQGDSYQQFMVLNSTKETPDGLILEGHLIREFQNIDDNFYVNDNGNLIVVSDDPTKYEIIEGRLTLKTD